MKLWRSKSKRNGKPPAKRGEGCSYWLFTSIVSVLMLCINVAVVQVAYESLTPLWPQMLEQPRVAQASVIIIPALMIFVEWWLWEAVIDRLIKDKKQR